MTPVEIQINKTFYNSPIIDAYNNQSDLLSPFYPNGFDIDGIIYSTKNKHFESNHRNILVEVLKDQYQQSNIDLKKSSVGKNIEDLRLTNSFTITAGQQIHAFLGPMFVAYKLLSAVALASECKAKDATNNYIPVFWMATEDHDFEEISHIHLFGETFSWEKPITFNAAVGTLSTNGLNTLGNQIVEKFKNDPETVAVIQKMQTIYDEIPNFADATRKIIHHFFESTGIVILDANDARLKTIFSPILKKEIENPQPELKDKYSNYLENNGFKKQINTRESNLFLFHKGNRERLKMKADNYETADSIAVYTKSQLLELLVTNPESFSPNVALRPLYQESILPNLAYISGGSEMIYWYQIMGLFEYYDISYPNVWLRKSGMTLSNKMAENISKAGLSIEDMFGKENDLTALIAKSLNTNNTELFAQLTAIQEIIKSFESTYRTSKIFNKGTLGYIKSLKEDINRLNKKIEEEQNDLLNESPLFSKIFKIQENFFRSKQERDLPLFTQLKNTTLFKSEDLYNYYIINANLLVFLD